MTHAARARLIPVGEIAPARNRVHEYSRRSCKQLCVNASKLLILRGARAGITKGADMHARFWTDMFIPALPVLEKIIRPILIYAFLVIGLRVAGKRELAQLNPFDLVVLLTLSNTVQNAIIGEDNSVTGGVIGAATLLAVNYIVVRFFFRHEKLDRLVEGDPELLIENGKIRM